MNFHKCYQMMWIELKIVFNSDLVNFTSIWADSDFTLDTFKPFLHSSCILISYQQNSVHIASSVSHFAPKLHRIPLRPSAQTTDSDGNEADKPTPWRGKNLVLTSLPSVSKTSKSSVMRYCVGATSCQTQFLFGGYSRGQPGLVMEPFSLVMKPPHAARGTNRKR